MNSPKKETSPVNHKKQWTEDLTISLQQGMEQVLRRVQEQTVSLKEKKDSVVINFDFDLDQLLSVVLVWQVFENLLLWASSYHESDQHIRAAAVRNNAQTILDDFNESLQEYCERGGLPEMIRLDIEKSIIDIHVLCEQTYLIELIFSLLNGIRLLIEYKSDLEISADPLSSVFGVLCYTSGSVLRAFVFAYDIPENTVSSVLIGNVNTMLKIYQTLHQQLTEKVDPSQLPPDFQKIQDVDSLKLQEFQGSAERKWRAMNSIEVDDSLSAANVVISTLQTHMIWLRALPEFWKESVIEPNLLERICSGMFTCIDLSLREIWEDESLEPRLEQALEQSGGEMIKELKQARETSFYSNEKGIKCIDDMLAYLERYYFTEPESERLAQLRS